MATESVPWQQTPWVHYSRGGRFANGKSWAILANQMGWGTRSLVSQAGVTGEGIVNNMQTILKEMFWKEADPGFACFPAFPRAGWTGECWEESLCVSGRLWAVNWRGYLIKNLLFTNRFPNWVPTKAVIKVPVCFDPLQNWSWLLFFFFLNPTKSPFERSLWERGHAQSMPNPCPPSLPMEQAVCATHLCLEPDAGCLHCDC